MKKLYIPTSSLNFNNIFSCESMSPASFYSKRDFGYKRFESTEPNPLLNSILLYSHYPHFQIKDKERDNYPMVIEIPFSNLEGKINLVKTYLDVEIFQLTESIYLNPFETQVFFQSEKHLSNALTMSEASMETKLIPVYRASMMDDSKVKDKFTWTRQFLLDIKDVDSSVVYSNIEVDKKINRIKGFAYCYLIGANSNLPSELLELKRIFKDIRNISSGLVNIYQNSIDSTIKSKTKTKNSNFFKEASIRLSELNSKTKRFVNISENQFVQNYPKSNFELEAFKMHGFYEDEISKLISFLQSYKSGRYSLYEHFQWAIQSTNQTLNTLSWLEKFKLAISYINSLFSATIKEQQYIKLEDIDSIYLLVEESLLAIEEKYSKQSSKLRIEQAFAIANLRLTTVFDSQLVGKSEFYQSIVNALIDVPIDNVEHFKSSKSELTRICGKILKEFVEEIQKKEWAKSPERIYINSLLDNLEAYHPFNIKSHPSEILQSFAAFMIKGDDPEKLKDFLITNDISDFRLSFGLWGSTFGFAAIPKTLTENFLVSDQSYTSSFYKMLTKQLFDYDIYMASEANIESKLKILYIPQDNITIEDNKNFSDSRPISTEQISTSQTSEKILCPICNSEMKLRSGQYGEFYGCTKFPDCKGTQQLRRDIKLTNENKHLTSLIIEFIEKHGNSKTSSILLYINNKIKETYNVKGIEQYIKQNLNNELEIIKIGQASGVAKRGNEFFS